METNSEVAIDALLRKASNAELLAYEHAKRQLADACHREANHHRRLADKARAEINRRKR